MTQERDLAQALAIIHWIEVALEGGELDDFALSFPPVRAVRELREERDEERFQRHMSDEILGIIREVLGKDDRAFVDDGVRTLRSRAEQLASFAQHVIDRAPDTEPTDEEIDDVDDPVEAGVLAVKCRMFELAIRARSALGYTASVPKRKGS